MKIQPSSLFFRGIFRSFSDIFLTPLKSLKKSYIPLLLIYFSYGAQGFTAISTTFWEKDNLTLSTEQLIMITVWVSLPFTMKILVGPFMDSVKILGSRRKIYVFFGAFLIALQYIFLAEMASQSAWIMQLGSVYQIYLFSALLGITGFMIQDVAADAMSAEVVDRRQKSAEIIAKELGEVQVLGRLSLYFAAMIVAGLGGWAASQYSFETIMWASLWIPILSIISLFFLKLPENNLDENNTDANPNQKPSNHIDKWIWIGAIGYVLFSILMSLSDLKFAQEIVFVSSLAILASLAWKMLKNRPRKEIITIVLLFCSIFIYRAMPNIGPGFTWWQIDELGFDQKFFGILAQTGQFIAVLFLWITASWVTKKSVRYLLLWLIFVGSILSLPELMLYHGIHEKIGVSAHALALIDTAFGSPLTNIAMIPMLTLIAFTSPGSSRATWFALMASLMNLAITAQTLGTKYLNQVFVISREIKDETGNITTLADYTQLGDLILWILLVGFFIPFLVVWFFCPKKLTTV